MTIDQKIALWSSSIFDAQTQKEVHNLKQKPAALHDAFYTELRFGTGGMRGIMGVGTNRINKYTLGRCTQGLANFLNEKNSKASVVVAYDSRHQSQSLAQEVAAVLSANNIKVYLFTDLRTTPELSFAVRYFRAQAGIVLTASHNPPEYNGYKVYGPDGGQIVPPMDQSIMNFIQNVSYDAIQFGPPQAKIHAVDQEVDAAYWNTVLNLMPEEDTATKDLKIVFTSLHGTAITAIPKVMALAGFKNLSIVKSQMHPDGDFPTVKSPNPEDPAALELALLQAKKENADLVIGTDPDCDRLGVVFRSNKIGDYIFLDGNQLMILLTDYVLRTLSLNNILGDKYFIATTIVSSPLMQKIAAFYNVKCITTLTGFKWIAEAIAKNPDQTFICGGEESYGFLIGDAVRDKDAVSAALLCAEMTESLKQKEKTLLDQLIYCYQTYGFSKQRLIAIQKEGAAGVKAIQKWMQQFRQKPPKSLGNSPLVTLADYKMGKEINLKTGIEKPLNLPHSNVIQFTCENGSIISMRPSGTEPKIKFYLSVNGNYQSELSWESNQAQLDKLLDQIETDLGL